MLWPKKANGLSRNVRMIGDNSSTRGAKLARERSRSLNPRPGRFMKQTSTSGGRLFGQFLKICDPPPA
jgi:hypothetical protein